jgi:hypothetical protein
MKYKKLAINLIEEDPRFMQLGIIEDSDREYIVMGKILPDMSIDFDRDVGLVWCELITKVQGAGIVMDKLETIDNDDERKIVYAFIEQTGMISLFSKIIKYLYNDWSSVQEQMYLQQYFERHGVLRGMDLVKSSFKKEIAYYQGKIRGAKLR